MEWRTAANALWIDSIRCGRYVGETTLRLESSKIFVVDDFLLDPGTVNVGGSLFIPTYEWLGRVWNVLSLIYVLKAHSPGPEARHATPSGSFDASLPTPASTTPRSASTGLPPPRPDLHLLSPARPIYRAR
jgi:hypothetical protein